jgi:hypothetical protein
MCYVYFSIRNDFLHKFISGTVYDDLTVILIFSVRRNFLDFCAVDPITTEINAHMIKKMI